MKTGLKDKNGREVCVGDKLKITRTYSDTSTKPWRAIKKDEFVVIKEKSWSCGCCNSIYGFDFGSFDEWSVQNSEVVEDD